MGLSKHGPLYRKLIWISLAVLLCGYVLCAALLGGGAPETVAASVCKVGDGCTVSGFVVFFEKTVATAGASPAVGTGARVSAGQCVAWRCSDRAAGEEKRALLARLAALTAPTAGSDAEIKAALHALTLAPTAEGAQALRNQILRREAVSADPEALAAAREELRTRARALELPPVCAPESGCFAEKAPSVVSPAALQGLSPAEFLQLRPETARVCCLITDDRWYFAALLPEARELLPGQTLEVRLTDALTVEMTVERVSTAPEGCLLVLSSRAHLAEAAALGQVRARLRFSFCEGLRVPKAAVQYRDGQTGVDVLVAGQVKFKPVTLLCEREDDFLAALTPGDPAALQPGDEMVVYS